MDDKARFILKSEPNSIKSEYPHSDVNTYYKFHKYDVYLYQMLVMKSFYAPNFEELNDPYDCRFQISNNFIREAYKKRQEHYGLEELFKSYMNSEIYKVGGKYLFEIIDNVGNMDENLTIEDLIEIINANSIVANDISFDLMKLLESRIVSFTKTETGDDLNMWAHYANSFYGVKLKFNFDDSEKHLKQGVKVVKYRHEWKQLNSIKDLKSAIFKKLINWKEEKEYRFNSNGRQFVSWEASSLKEITFGYKMNNREIKSIIDLCESLKFNCEYYVLKMNYNGMNKERIIQKPFYWIKGLKRKM